MKKLKPESIAISIAVIVAVMAIWTTGILSGQPVQNEANIEAALADALEEEQNQRQSESELSEEKSLEGVLLVPTPEL